MVSREDLTNQIISKYQKKKVKNYIQRQPPSDFEYNPWEFEHPWVRGLCNCTEQCDELCYSFCCYPCFSCHLAWRLNESCWIACCLPGYLAILRTKVRTAFRIEGSYFCDFCTAECCPICTSLQIASELRFHKVMR